jgi:predicted DNA-binding ArsR family transcriptional regulator
MEQLATCLEFFNFCSVDVLFFCKLHDLAKIITELPVTKSFSMSYKLVYLRYICENYVNFLALTEYISLKGFFLCAIVCIFKETDAYCYASQPTSPALHCSIGS